MIRRSLLCVAPLFLLTSCRSAPPPATSAPDPSPPTPARGTTYFVEPLVDGWVDYAAALDRAFGDADAPPGDNAFAGLLGVIAADDGIPERDAAIRERLELPPRGGPTVDLSLFDDLFPPGRPRRPWVGDPDLAAGVDEVHAELDAIVASLGGPAWYVPTVRYRPGELILTVTQNHLGELQSVSTVLLLRGLGSVRDRDLAGAARDWRALARLSRLQTREWSVGSSLQAAEHAEKARILLRAILASSPERPGLLRSLAATLADLPASRPLARKLAVSERAVSLDFVQSVLREPTKHAAFLKRWRAAPGERVTFDGTLRRVNDLWDAWFERIPDAYADAGAHLAAVEAAAAELRRATDRAVDGSTALSSRVLSEEIVIDVLGHPARSARSWLLAERTREAWTGVEAVAIAAARFRAERGAFPRVLDALVPAFLPTLPPDRFTGDPLHCEVTPTGFTVWSVGPDGDDDGGVEDRRGLDGDLSLTVSR